MIKIKDYIFNENEIEYIKQDKDHLSLYFKRKKGVAYRFISNATFDDIEWNYGNTDLEELKLDYSAVVTSYKKLEEESKKLKFAMQDTYDSANDTCGELQQKLKETIKELSLQNKTTIKGYDYLKSPYKVTCKGEK